MGKNPGKGIAVKWRRAAGALGTLATAVLVLAVLAAAAAWKFADVRYVPILTGSMAPQMPRGSMAITAPIVPGEVKEGMVIAFVPPDPWAPKDGNPVVHRVWKLDRADRGKLVAMETKGDHNDTADPWRINLSHGGGTYAKVIAVVPRAGSAARAVERLGVPGTATLLGGALLLGYGIPRLWRTVRPAHRARGSRASS